MPVTFFKGDEFGTSQSSNGFGTADALFGKEVSKAISTIRFVFTRSELLSRQNLIAVGASKALFVPRGTFIGNASLVDNPTAFQASLRKVLFIAGYTNYLLIARDETLVTNRLLAHRATETFLMPLLTLVLKFLHASFEDVGAAIATSSKVIVMAISAIKLVVLGGKGLIHQRVLTVNTLEAFLVPMLFFVR
jgi:hypothetical protein